MLHVSVLLKEAVDSLNINPEGVYVDATFGRGGHTRAILTKLAASGKCVAFDRDVDAEQFANENINSKQFIFVHDVYHNMQTHIQQLGYMGKVNGVLFDVGVSSCQLDTAERGFSFLKDGPLDMRMDITKGQSAKDILEVISEKKLAKIIRELGEEKFSGRIARVICEQRRINPIETTFELVKIIESIVPFREKHKHPATRTFQALRIYVNDEINALKEGLNAAINVLAPYGRMVIITFHSLEYQIVKKFIASQLHHGIPTSIPLTQDLIKPGIKVICKGKSPSEQEIYQNVRARSAKLTVLEKTEY